MKIKLNKQRKIALAALAAVAALASWPETDRPVAAPRGPSAQTQLAETREPATRIEMPARDAMPQLGRDPFSAEAPVKKPVKTAIAAAPAAPMNPYRFAGELRVGGVTQRFLARGDETFEARVGDELDDGYAVESVSAGAIVLVHRASGAHQALAVGAPAWEDPARSRVVQSVPPAASPAVVAGDVLRLDPLTANLPQGYFVAAGSMR